MENKNKGLVVAVIALAICVLGLAGYLVYDKVLNKKIESTDEPKVVNTETTTTSSPNIDIEGMGRALFTKYSIRDDSLASYVSRNSLEYAFYPDTPVSYNTMSNELRMYLAYQNVGRAKVVVRNNSCDSDLSCIVESVDLESFKASFTDLFGGDKAFAFSEFKNSCSLCKLENDTINCYGYMGCGNDWDSFAKIEYNKTILKDKSLIISVTKTYVDNTKKQIGEAHKYSLNFNKDTLDNWYWVSTTEE